MKRIFGRFCRNAGDYFRTHMGVPVTLSVIGLLLTAILILQYYVKNQYLSYLLEETGRTEQAVLEASAANINNTLRDIIETGCTIAVNSTLRNTVEMVQDFEDTADSAGRKNLMLKEELSLMTHYSNSIAAVAIVTEDGLLQEYGRYWEGGSYSNLWTGESLETLDEIYREVMERTQLHTGARYYVSETPSTHESLPNVGLFHLALPLLGGSSNLNGVTAVVVVTFRLDAVVDESTMTGYLAGLDDTILYHEDGSSAGMSIAAYQENFPENEDLSCALDYFGWTVHVTIDAERMQGQVNHMYQGSIFVYLLLLSLCALIWQFAIRRILRPVNTIREAMQDIRLGSTRKKIEIGGSHEIWQLAQDYNDMLDSLHRQQEEIDRQYQEKTLSIRQKNKAEREALESQINAHFLCNTLTAITYTAIEDGNDEVAMLLKKLSNMLAYSFARRTASITLGMELKWVEEYLYLQKFRLMEVFDYEIDVPQEYSEWPVCKFFLQPFVENSILHGMEGREMGGWIRISGRPEGNRFRITICDNGCGMDPEMAETLQNMLKEPRRQLPEGCGIGIQNAVTRLQMYYGEELMITLETVKGQGTCFTFRLPLVEQPGEEFMGEDSV